MHQLVEAFRRGADLSVRSGAPSRDGFAAAGDDGGKPTAATSDGDASPIAARDILTRLGRCESEGGACKVLSDERGIANIPHIRQSENWDCGLACMQMILAWLKQSDFTDELLDDTAIANNEEAANREAEGQRCEKEWMVDFVATRSIWTIDLVILLAYIIRGRGGFNIECVLGCQESSCHHQKDCFSFEKLSSVSYLYCSTTFEVNDSYNTMNYYKDAFASDEKRVKKLFEIASKRKVPLLKTPRISLETLVDIVSREGVVAVVLVDNRILRNEASDSYSGHYVILCGISYDENDIEYANMDSSAEEKRLDSNNYCMVLKNPGIWKRCEYVAPSRFEEAWRAKGTDEDVIFIASSL
ncbi:hypothetical protein ACHAXT_006741 [Thalassiosira profunda]